MLLLLDWLPQGHQYPDFSYFLLSFPWPPTFYTFRASPPSVDKLTSSPLCPISSFLLFLPQTASPQAKPDPWACESTREKSLLCSSLSDPDWLAAVMAFDLFPDQEVARGERLYPSLHLADVISTVLLYSQSETERLLLSWPADVSFTSLTKHGEDLMPGITSPLQVKETFSKHVWS